MNSVVSVMPCKNAMRVLGLNRELKMRNSRIRQIVAIECSTATGARSTMFSASKSNDLCVRSPGWRWGCTASFRSTKIQDGQSRWFFNQMDCTEQETVSREISRFTGIGGRALLSPAWPTFALGVPNPRALLRNDREPYLGQE